LLGAVSGIDTGGQRVLLGHEAIPYDYLVIATGATHSYFGNDAWAPYAPGLKRIEDAIEIRRRILIAFERAEVTADAVERCALDVSHRGRWTYRSGTRGRYCRTGSLWHG
jgi:NADH dehydrogenase FAD-containing subunit